MSISSCPATTRPAPRRPTSTCSRPAPASSTRTLLAASDGLVGKIGYSTLAEVYAAGVAYGYVPRPRFRESDVLSLFVEKEMSGFAIDADELSDGRWIERVPDLLALPRRVGERVNGAEEIATFLQTGSAAIPGGL